MGHKTYPYYVANKPIVARQTLAVTDKYTGKVAFRVARAGAPEIEKAIQAAHDAAGAMRKLPAYRRRDILLHCVKRITEQREKLALTVCIEAGKPITDARGEVTRLIDTLQVAAEESTRIGGEVLPLDISPRAQGFRGMWKRVPVGPCALITPWNFPLNLVAHKIGPAIAAGCPFVLKPASFTPVSALLIGAILAETDLPAGAFSILPCTPEAAQPLVTDERIKLLSFTGSAEVGWNLRKNAGHKKVSLELGGNAAVIVDQDSDIDDVVPRLVRGAFYQSGQSCVSVQRIYAHENVYEVLRDKLVAATRKLKVGNPRNQATFIGPMISKEDAARLEGWIIAAVKSGATLLCGGKRRGAILEPTLLENVPADEPLSCQEAFGPVAVLERFSDFDEAIRRVNDSRFGLQAGVFSRDIHKINRAWDELEVGAVIVNESPAWRVDHMPYGGVKMSGMGREGVRFAIEEMTEIRLLALRDQEI